MGAAELAWKIAEGGEGKDFAPSLLYTSCVLLYAVVVNVRTDQSVKDSQDVASVFHHTSEDIAQFRLALRFFVPLCKDQCRHFDVPSEFFRGMAT